MRNNEYTYEWTIFGSFSNLSPDGILQGFVILTQDIWRMQDQLSLLLLQFGLCWPPFCLKMTGLRERKKLCVCVCERKRESSECVCDLTWPLHVTTSVSEPQLEVLSGLKFTPYL